MKRCFPSFFLLLLLLASATRLQAHVEKYYYLRGSLGQTELVVKMLCYDEMPTRHLYYFTTSDKQDRYLVGKNAEGRWLFRPEQPETGADTKTLLAIAEQPNGSWTGRFTDRLGLQQNVLLHPFGTDSIVSPFNDLMPVRETTPYEQYRLASIRFTKEKTTVHGKDLAADWFVEQESGISFFRLRAIGKPFRTDSINAALTMAHLSMIARYYQYRSSGPPARPGTRITYLSPAILSYEVNATLPDPSQKPVQVKQFATLDLHSGQPVNLEELLWFGAADDLPDPGDLFRIYKYRNSIFAPRLYELLQQLYPAHMKSDTCGINQVGSWALPVWCLTSRGIAFGLKTTSQCAVSDWAIIPYEKLKPYRVGKYRL